MKAAASLFAGIGALDLALRRCGVEVDVQVELDPEARGCPRGGPSVRETRGRARGRLRPVPPVYRSRLGCLSSAIIRTVTEDGRVVYKAATPTKTYRKKDAPKGQEWAEARFLGARDLALLEVFARDLRLQLEELDRRERGARVVMHAPRYPARHLTTGAKDLALEAHDAVVQGLVAAAVRRRSAAGEPAAEGLAPVALEAGGVEPGPHEEGADLVDLDDPVQPGELDLSSDPVS